MKPHANFSADKTTIKELEMINFKNLSSGNPTSCFWNFGNGKTSTEIDPQNIQYCDVGSYTVSLITSNAFGSDTIIKQNYIQVNPSQLNCSNPVNLTFGVPFNGNTNNGHSNVNKYNCKTWSENGPEVVHIINTKEIGNITASLSNMHVDLDIFLLSSCKENSCIVGGGNSITYSNAPVGTYYIIVDGNEAGNYKLTPSFTPANINEFGINNFNSLFPNPNNGAFTLKFNDKILNTESILEIYSSFGNLVFHEKLRLTDIEKPIILTSLPEGVYFIQLILKDGENFGDKFLITK